uniref:Uncharacterized protein n=1 Tax=Tanacetum cinerariifolium TaxID=118510 RepID=A0A699JEZ2_TANCI|nr:hypothetical protein [Tanacetum cinerariifolium]
MSSLWLIVGGMNSDVGSGGSGSDGNGYDVGTGGGKYINDGIVGAAKHLARRSSVEGGDSEMSGDGGSVGGGSGGVAADSSVSNGSVSSKEETGSTADTTTKSVGACAFPPPKPPPPRHHHQRMIDIQLTRETPSDQVHFPLKCCFRKCMTRSSTKELFTPFKDLEREFRSSMKLFKTLSLNKSRSLEFNLFFDREENSKEEVAKTMGETIEQYMSKT